jgi:pyruvate/2-oxoglutarate dehydrogenase complex dihydrolipoamide acyltransferase (E2) component
MNRNMNAALFQGIGAGVVALVLSGCVGASAPDGSASASNAAPASSGSSVQSAAAPPPVAMPSVAPSVAAPAAPSASASAASDAPVAAPSASAAAPAEEAPIPKVKVKNIGMHIGGGPNDDVTKEPIKRSVEPHFDAFRRCFAKVEDQAKGGDFGVDVLIEANGGKAKITHPRTALKGAGFEECVVLVFESIEFLKPKGGKKTMVSYSIRFTP